MDRENVTTSVKDARETYSFLALMIIYPFRTIDDLTDNESDLYWTKFVILRDTNQLKNDGLQIFQNIQDQIQFK